MDRALDTRSRTPWKVVNAHARRAHYIDARGRSYCGIDAAALQEPTRRQQAGVTDVCTLCARRFMVDPAPTVTPPAEGWRDPAVVLVFATCFLAALTVTIALVRALIR